MVQQRENRPFAKEEEAFCVTVAVHLAAEIAHARAKRALEELGAQKRRRKKQKQFYLVYQALQAWLLEPLWLYTRQQIWTQFLIKKLQISK
ncbi:hypothetical protein [Coxiella-like endosymbiont of Rhipicephalus sanguineus]|uniref:hypothetical protein n=1 Tax=Coxiella-like endosymbiont of Rhipicephalus sanguineus TaxID=1955402 RepID=UPI00204048E5|nr:hypothetical protein [Coxiella-like endosymbiont of Rhipicephalus sanguineus]